MSRSNGFLNSVKEHWLVWAVTAGLLAVSAALHIWWHPSPMTMTEEIWQKKVALHLTRPEFAIRYFQTYATLLLHKISGLPLREAFFVIQFALAMLLGPVFFRFLRALGFNRGWSYLGLVLLLTAYPMLGAHFAPTYTWDDFWAYLFLTLSLLAVLGQRPALFSLWFTLAVFAREPVAIFWPLCAVFLWRGCHGRASRGHALLYLALPPLVYCLFRLVVWESIDPKRWQLITYNLANGARISDTLMSVLISFGVMWLLSIVGLWLVRHRLTGTVARLLFWGLITTLPLNTIMTLLFTLARETRIFFPPFVFVIPLSLVTLQAGWRRARHSRSWLLLVVGIFAVPALIWAGLETAYALFAQWDFGRDPVLRRRLAGIHFGLIFLGLGCIAAWAVRNAVSGQRTVTPSTSADDP